MNSQNLYHKGNSVKYTKKFATDESTGVNSLRWPSQTQNSHYQKQLAIINLHYIYITSHFIKHFPIFIQIIACFTMHKKILFKSYHFILISFFLLFIESISQIKLLKKVKKISNSNNFHRIRSCTSSTTEPPKLFFINRHMAQFRSSVVVVLDRIQCQLFKKIERVLNSRRKLALLGSIEILF